MATNNSINSSIPNSPAGVINIGTDAVAHTITIGNTTGATALAFNMGTGDFTLASATGTTMLAADEGWITYPLQPSFLAELLTGDADVTGAGTTYTLGSGNALTEVFDQNGDFTTAGVFTAPVTGRYLLTGGIRVENITSAMTAGFILFTTSNRDYSVALNPYPIITGTEYGFHISVFGDMDASDTASLQLLISNGAGDTADVVGATGETWVAGCLLM